MSTTCVCEVIKGVVSYLAITPELSDGNDIVRIILDDQKLKELEQVLNNPKYQG